MGLDARLTREASNGKIAHKDLERVIDVNATSDVIRYLDREGYIVDLDGEYLVEEAIDEYAGLLATEIGEAVEEKFEESSHVLQTDEFEQVIENEIDARFEVLSKAQSVRTKILDETQTKLIDQLGLDLGRRMVEIKESFDSVTDDHARRIHSTVKAEADQLPGMLPEWVDLAEAHIEELQVSNATAVNEHVRDEVREQYRALVNEQEFGGRAD